MHFLGTELFGQHGGDDVDVLHLIDGQKQVCLAHGGFFKNRESSAVALDCYHIGGAAYVVEQFGVAVDDRYVVHSAAEHLGQMAAYLSCTRDDYFHKMDISSKIITLYGF